MVSAGDATYTYRADGIRISKTHQYLTNQFTVVGGNVWKDFFGTYTRGIELISNGRQIYLYNIRGDVIQLLKFDGSIYTTYDYDAYGNEYERDNNDGNYFRYCGEYYDTETGFIYLRARYYDPMVGRFTSVDPIKSGLNWYSYCYNNPVIFVDRDGRSATLIFLGIVLAHAATSFIGSIVEESLDGDINWGHVATDTVFGTLDGVIKASPLDPFSKSALSALVTAGDSTVDKLFEKDISEFKWYDWGEIAVESVADGVSSYKTFKNKDYNKMVSDTYENIGERIERENRRSNQEYAEKAISRLGQELKDFDFMTTTDAIYEAASEQIKESGLSITKDLAENICSKMFDQVESKNEASLSRGNGSDRHFNMLKPNNRFMYTYV